MSMRPGPKAKNHIFTAFKVSLAVGLFYWLFQSGRLQLDELSRTFANWEWLLLAQVFFLGTQVLNGLRWKLLLRAQSIEYPLSSTVSLTLVGWFFNQVAFGSTGGDIYKAYAVARGCPTNPGGGIVSVLVDRAFGLLALFVLIIAAGILNFDFLRANPELRYLFLLSIGVAVALPIAAWLYFSGAVRRSRLIKVVFSRLSRYRLAGQLHEAIDAYRSYPKILWSSAVMSVAMQLLIVAMNVCLARTLLNDFDWLPFLLIVPAAHLAMAVPINPPGALGTAEALYAYLFELAGITLGGLIALLQRITFIAWSLVGAAIFVSRKHWSAVDLRYSANAEKAG
ncbi:lysylphosphatidylglycerol synthase transmembrane domain-containing protein [Ferruginivarius sediminum]|uniref:UPF0104 family protein n=1 Tax=Ferruginivarius sediminum TaxID=2661937 RepID=A0A369TBR8_9PROT|nr:lysylphosphatidylglycerol synthase transmembrane domain-containing protein [Ferruginivarius sediminum]RDD62292.1 UPF0104 family protein [Ferruginivarius sediminum]